MNRTAIQEGLDHWQRLQQLAAHSTRYMERADAARRAQDAPARKVPRGLGGMRPASSAAVSRIAAGK